MTSVGLRILGGFELTDHAGAMVGLTSRKGRALLAYLALNPDRNHERGELAALLWGGRGEAHARDSLNKCLQTLGKALGNSAEDFLEMDRETILLCNDAVDLDVARLRRLADSDDIDDLAREANDTPYGLSAGIWTSNITKANQMAAKLKAGTVWINCHNVFDPHLPFGGYKESGIGREMGPEVMDLYTEVKAVCIGGL